MERNCKLFIPGPCDVDDDVLDAMRHPVQRSYGARWMPVYNETIELLRQVFQTRNDILIVPGPGSAGLDMALGSMMANGEKVIVAHNGVIDNYAGDGIKANFGIPVPRSREEEIQADAFNAVKCALAMEKEMEQLNKVWEERHLPAVGMRIGIFTGPVVAGLLGGSERLKYTTIGDSVNTASRLESYDKDLGKDRLCRILVGESTMHYVQGHFRAEKVGEASLKGKTEKVVIYRILPSSEA